MQILQARKFSFVGFSFCIHISYIYTTFERTKNNNNLTNISLTKNSCTMISIPYRQLTELQKQLNVSLSIVNQLLQFYQQASGAFSGHAVSKSELATLVGVSSRTFAGWLRDCRSELRAMGVKDRARYLPAEAVAFICERYVIIPTQEKCTAKLQ